MTILLPGPPPGNLSHFGGSMMLDRVGTIRTGALPMQLPTPHARTDSVIVLDLTAPERDVLHLLVAGLGTPAIVATLLVAPDVVRIHTHSIMIKLGATSRMGIVAIALRDDLLGTCWW